MFKYRILGVRKKKELKEKFGEKILGGNFAKFVFTGQTLCLFFLQVKVTEKKMEIFKVFFGAVRN